MAVTHLQTAYQDGVSAALARYGYSMQKEARQAGIGGMLRAILEGRGASAHKIWGQRPSWLKPTTQFPEKGLDLARLGRGAEGRVDAVVQPTYGLSARKHLKDTGLAAQELTRRKEHLGKAIGENPHVAQWYGSMPDPGGKGTLHFSEYVPAMQGPADVAAMRKAKAQAILAARRAGFHTALDIHSGNMIRDARTGVYKVVDMVPAYRNEVIPQREMTRLRDLGVNRSGVEPSKLYIGDEGLKLFNLPAAPSPRAQARRLRKDQNVLAHAPTVVQQTPQADLTRTSPLRVPQGRAITAPTPVPPPVQPQMPQVITAPPERWVPEALSTPRRAPRVQERTVPLRAPQGLVPSDVGPWVR